ncbi:MULTISPECIES: hypothetical protein [unclassified Ruegeria]|uniref:hypothetical protein n=1 Tax=unclassified Ruegeria TaxID=2625375 RepID=UPI0014894698|nr:MULTISPECIES: hypothetical protein [unclassified Ruegeria]
MKLSLAKANCTEAKTISRLAASTPKAGLFRKYTTPARLPYLLKITATIGRVSDFLKAFRAGPGCVDITFDVTAFFLYAFGPFLFVFDLVGKLRCRSGSRGD